MAVFLMLVSAGSEHRAYMRVVDIERKAPILRNGRRRSTFARRTVRPPPIDEAKARIEI